MCIGKKNIIKTALVFLTIFCFFSCHKEQVVINEIADVDLFLNGIWYKSVNPSISKPVKEKFRWGDITFDYWNALCFDIKGGEGHFQLSDGGYIIQVAYSSNGRIEMIGTNPPSPEKINILLEILGDKAIALSIKGGATTGFLRDLVGTWYKTN